MYQLDERTRLGLRQRVANLLTGNGHQATEIIGRQVLAKGQIALFKARARTRSIDETIPDYEFWDKLRRGKAIGYALGGLYCRRIESIFASWTLGRGVMVTLDDEEGEDNEDRKYTNGELASFIEENHSLLLRVEADKMGLGDQYVVVNTDGSLSVPPPDTVEVERDEFDYRKIVSITIETKLEKRTIRDEYRADGRTLVIVEGGEEVSRMTFANLIGRIPIVHLAHDMGSNETNGHPIHESLLPLYDEYDNTAYKQLDGANLLGNPLLAFVGMEDIDAVINANDPGTQDTYTDKDGATATRTQLNVDQNAMLLVGKGGDAKFVAPPTGFTTDTKAALKTLFLLLLDHTGIPEFIWGGEMGASRSSTETQMIQFSRDIRGRQKENNTWLVPLCEIWLAMTALTDGRLVQDKLKVKWPPLIDKDENILLRRVEIGHSRGLITDKTALIKLDLVENPEEELEKAKEEHRERQEEMFPEGNTSIFQQRINRDEDKEGGEDVQE